MRPEFPHIMCMLHFYFPQLRVAKVTGGAASKLAKIGTTRKNIARVLTVYNQNQAVRSPRMFACICIIRNYYRGRQRHLASARGACLPCADSRPAV